MTTLYTVYTKKERKFPKNPTCETGAAAGRRRNHYVDEAERVFEFWRHPLCIWSCFNQTTWYKHRIWWLAFGFGIYLGCWRWGHSHIDTHTVQCSGMTLPLAPSIPSLIIAISKSRYPILYVYHLPKTISTTLC